eukprot:14123321-Heterocapsa_arctica.AAC.1
MGKGAGWQAQSSSWQAPQASKGPNFAAAGWDPQWRDQQGDNSGQTWCSEDWLPNQAYDNDGLMRQGAVKGWVEWPQQ